MDPDLDCGAFGAAEELFHRALDLPEGERAGRLEEWCAGDRALLDEVLGLLDGLSHVEAALAEPKPPPPDPWIGRDLGCWRIERLLGAGGMGAVYLASRTDAEFHMRAAVKVLASRLVLDAAPERFLAERQILARLDHPGIARLIDGGVTALGEAWLAMEYVEGPPLDRWVEQRRPALDGLLRLMLEVCDAVEYAHRNLVLHRDLKPGNILVSAGDRPKLLDFGNARLLGAEASGGLTRLGYRAFTPEFASPEQVLGGAVTAASDVYSLGVVLYRLLTGRAPYVFSTHSSGELVSVLRDAEPPPPSAAITRVASGADAAPTAFEPERRRRELRGDLDAIVMRALCKEPERRYPSVAELAADLHRFLEGHPVAAREATFRYRAGKFIRRRRRALAASFTVAALLAGGVAATAWEARRARVEEARANRRFHSLRDLNRALLFDFYDAVQRLPGSAGVQRALIAESIAQIDRLRRDFPHDPDIAIDAIEAYTRLGGLQRNRADESLVNRRAGAAGDRAADHAAAATLRKALDLAAALAREHPGEARVPRLAGLAEQGLGEVRLDAGDLAAARDHLERAARALDRIAARSDAPAAALADAAGAHFALGDLSSRAPGRREAMAAAEADFTRAGELYRQALEREPTVERSRRGAAVVRLKRAELLREIDPASAADLLSVALADLDRLPEAARAALPNQRLAAALHAQLAGALASLAQYDSAIAHARRALRICASAATLDPAGAGAQADLALASCALADVLDRQACERGAAGDLDAARRAHRSAASLADALRTKSPGDPLWSGITAWSYYRIAALSWRLHEDPAAASAWEQARSRAVGLANRIDVSGNDLTRAATLFSSEEVPPSHRDLARARACAGRLAAFEPSPQGLVVLARIARLDGDRARAANRIAEAEALLPAAAQGRPPSELRKRIEEERKRLRR